MGTDDVVSMSNIKRVFRITPSVRFRVLAIALIPSSSLLIVGGGTAGYFLHQADSIQTWSTAINHTAGPALDFVEAVQNERRTSMLVLSGNQSAAADLPAERARLNASIPTMMAAGNDLIKLFHGSVGDAVVQMQSTFGQLPLIRQRVDLGAAQTDEVYGYYNKVIQTVIVAGRLAARTAKVPEAANEQDTEIGLFETAEAMSRSSTLAAAGAFHGGFSPSQQEEYSKLVGFYRYELDNRIGELTPEEMASYQALVSSPAWRQMGAVESGLIRRTVDTGATQPGGSAAGPGQPGSSVPGATQSGPGGSTSGAAPTGAPGSTQTGATGPGGAAGAGATPQGAQSTSQPGVSSPGTAQPGVSAPGSGQSGAAPSGTASSPRTSAPRNASPGGLAPGAGQQGSGQQGAGQQGSGQQGSGPSGASGTSSTGNSGNSSGTSSSGNSAANGSADSEGADSADAATAPPMPPVAEWQDAADQVSAALRGMWNSHLRYAGVVADHEGSRLSRQATEGGAAALALSLIAFVAAAGLSQRLIGRLRRLRAETLAVSETRLPTIMGQLGRSEPVDLDKAVPKLDFGRDEIGQVADAFNRAQTAAITAAVNEAHTRQGVRAVFVNIAHRSQVTMHQLLGLLERAEHRHDDPDTLKMLFEFDNLATRERRNAENLVILGGEQPGRQWRNPVPLQELVRSAVTETEHYARVHIVRLPEVPVVGSAVADLIHLLAELIDNAATFSPPRTRVEITGELGGSAVIVEISDLGVGLTKGEMSRFNDTLANPPDFNIEALSSDSRLGLFVVAQLAKRHEVAVRLTESDFGGIRSVVRIPYDLVADGQSDPDADETTEDDLGELRRWSHRLIGQQPGLPGPPELGTPPGEPVAMPVVPEPEPVGAMASFGNQAAAEMWVDGPSDSIAGAPAYDEAPPLPQRRRQTQVIPQPPAAPDVHPSIGRQRDRPTGQGRPTDLWTSLQAGTKLGRAGVPAGGSRIETDGEGQWND
ncbi:sensor histidine kinase [Nocardia sp. alder85J]|uniref:sensor histidine kinase n=1 Tax=Nocardia sp. alder85J TaxID=2862949 RepID=UPI001CD3D550|nr:sensor histidine kinase [Nocardia sp. alder85J]MCX4098763.1 nitrate- and nitrite sensing domain-containing protein [Nocardia sp. alder85J]